MKGQKSAQLAKAAFVKRLLDVDRYTL